MYRHTTLLRTTFAAAGLLGFAAGGHASSAAAAVESTAPVVSRSFELRALSADPKANGETDFKGATEVFNTEQRIEFLRAYATYAKRFFNDPKLDTEVVTDAEVRAALRSLKPQPQPAVRQRVALTQWKYLGCRPGQREAEERECRNWGQLPGLRLADGALVVTTDRAIIARKIAKQSWRFFLQWRVRPPAAPASFAVGDVVRIAIDSQGRVTRATAEGSAEVATCALSQWVEFKVEVDLESGRYNVFVDGVLRADFVPILSKAPVETLTFEGSKGLRLDDLWGVGYEKHEFTRDVHTRDAPFGIRTFLDENFEVRPNPVGWEQPAYDDSAWQPVPRWPYAHGGERHAGEDLYLRTRVVAPVAARAFLDAECLDPEGEVWINGQVVEVRHDRHPFRVDVTRFIRSGAENLIAVRVRPFKVERTMRHTPADLHTGWFAGRLTLDFTAGQRITDVFAFTRELAPAAKMEVRVRLHNDGWAVAEREVKDENVFNGRLQLALTPWFPEERNTPVVSSEVPVALDFGRDVLVAQTLEVLNPELWSPEHPRLYKLSIRLLSQEGKVLDDEVVTTGIRTVTQEGGTFRLNGQPAMMNGALLFGFRPPLDRIAQWMKCGPEEWLVRDLLMLRKMNANTARMSHHDGPAGSINDPRYAEIGDQLGVMFQWATTAWLRTGNPWQMDFAGLPRYVRLVRNHPSIAMWQPGNHPSFKNGFKDGVIWFEKIYQTIAAEDPSRLICPLANNDRMKPPNHDGTIDRQGRPAQPVPVWTAPLAVRGNMEWITGYGADWTSLRKYPFPAGWAGEDNWRETGFKADYLASREHAYFDFESEESGAQPNWNLCRGKPWYHLRSYEITYDQGSIGRTLDFDEWEISQAWQAFSGYEAYRKKRWLDFDGLAWCTLDGGGNTATYEKPLTDFDRRAKLGWHAVKMAFQPILAGSKNVDVVYGPRDQIAPMVLNLGPGRSVDLAVIVRDLAGRALQTQSFPAVRLAGGRTVTDLPPFKPAVPVGTTQVAVEYVVTNSPAK